MSRVLKQILVASIFILILAGLGFSFYFITKATPRCDDGIRNGKEEGVDCGLIACNIACVDILPLQILSTQTLEVDSGKYDGWAKIYNPNSSFGADQAEYELTLLDSQGQVILSQLGETYILPGQTKYIVLPSLRSAEIPSVLNIKFNRVDWRKLDKLGQEVNFRVIRQNYVRGTGENSPSQVEAVIFNESNFDLDRVDVGVIILDDSGEVVGVSRTAILTFLAGSERQFEVSVPKTFSSDVRIILEISTNVFENSNFIKSHGIQEKFQKYY